MVRFPGLVSPAPTTISILLKISKARPGRHSRTERVQEVLLGFRMRGTLWGLGGGREALNTDCCWCVPTQVRASGKNSVMLNLVLLHPLN